MTVLLQPPPDICVLLAQIPSAEDFTAARLRRALRFLIDAAKDWLALEETHCTSADAAFNMDKEELGLNDIELEWFLDHLPRGYHHVHGEDGVTLLIYTP